MRPTSDHPLLAGLALCVLLTSPAAAGGSRPVYVDGGQSSDGRFVVTAERVEEPAKEGGKGGKARTRTFWRFTWRDTRDGSTCTGELVGLQAGRSQVFDPVHAHIYVAPDGQTFAVWDPQAYAAGTTPPANGLAITDPAFRNAPALSHTLTIYRKNGEIVKALGVKDFVQEWEWAFVVTGLGARVRWLQAYPGLNDSNVPRMEYAYHRISPDRTVLEFTIGPSLNAGAQRIISERDPEGRAKPRVVRVSLIDGRIFAAGEFPTGVDQTPVRPFIGDLTNVNALRHYRASIDPLRIPGTYVIVSDKPKDDGKDP